MFTQAYTFAPQHTCPCILVCTRPYSSPCAHAYTCLYASMHKCILINMCVHELCIHIHVSLWVNRPCTHMHRFDKTGCRHVFWIRTWTCRYTYAGSIHIPIARHRRMHWHKPYPPMLPRLVWPPVAAALCKENCSMCRYVWRACAQACMAGMHPEMCTDIWADMLIDTTRQHVNSHVDRLTY